MILNVFGRGVAGVNFSNYGRAPSVADVLVVL